MKKLALVFSLLLTGCSLATGLYVPKSIEQSWDADFKPSPSPEWVQCLEGHRSGKTVVITSQKPATIYYADSMSVSFDCHKGAIGFSHSHPNYTCDLSSLDLRTLYDPWNEYEVAIAVCGYGRYAFVFRGIYPPERYMRDNRLRSTWKRQ